MGETPAALAELKGPDGSRVIFTPCSDCGKTVNVKAIDFRSRVKRQSGLSVHYARVLYRKYQEAGYKING